MANSYFQFKQFTIHQERCAMKVSTEACILGAWTTANRPNRILDIGTGTGLLALMMAQKYECTIDAVEIDLETAQQAKENIEQSPWANRIHVIPKDIVAFMASSTVQYDLIVCNPPFFQSSQQSEDFKEKLAKHETTFFEKKKLVLVLNHLLSEYGVAYVIYPPDESIKFQKEVDKSGLYHQSSLIIRNQSEKAPFRIISQVSKQNLFTPTKELSIRNGIEFTSEFKDLMQPYLLK